MLITLSVIIITVLLMLAFIVVYYTINVEAIKQANIKIKEESVNVSAQAQKEESVNVSVQKQKEESVNVSAQAQKEESVNVSVQKQKEESVNVSAQAQKEETIESTFNETTEPAKKQTVVKNESHKYISNEEIQTRYEDYAKKLQEESSKYDQELQKLAKEKIPNDPYSNRKNNVKLEVKNLQVSFRTQGGTVKAVRDISFDLNKGETFAIVGESGSGKSVTSKAIIGILAGNSIVEGGEILYDGQDLLKISEEDYHKIRGDKIAMIFQDPMSSLNPIMKVGKQLTEAMLLKAKASKRNARRDFNSLLARLNDNIDEANANNPNYSAKEIKKMVKTFDSFCIENIVIEGIYNDAIADAMEAEFQIDNLFFLMENKQKVDLIKTTKTIIKLTNECIHPFVLVKTDALNQLLTKLQEELTSSEHNTEVIITLLKELKEIIHASTNREKPNFFTLAYYKMVNPDIDVTSMKIDELNKMTRKYIDENFMLNFIEFGSQGVYNSHYLSILRKKNLLPLAYETLGYFYKGEVDKKTAYKKVKALADKVEEAIDRLVVKKNSTEYVFRSAITSGLDRYYEGVKTNPKELKKYNCQKAKYDKLISEGKILDWTLKPLVQVDLELAKVNICKTIENLIYSIEHDIEIDPEFNSHDSTIEIIDYLKEQASRVVVKMNKSIAKAKAIKLLEEVGIPEPNIRFGQYPFEFSGGMRQRVVIAIALSANPDILICDEPTTALDVTIQSQILELINVIKKERNLSVIFITHNLGVVANMADRIGVMYAGKIVEYGTADEIFYDPHHPYTWALLSSMPDLHTKDRLESIPGTPPNMIYPPVGDAFAPRNKYALEIDFEMQPPLFEITPTHYAATWLLHPDAPKVEMPKIIRDRVARLKEEMAKDENNK